MKKYKKYENIAKNNVKYFRVNYVQCTQEELAMKLDIARDTLSDIENEKINPSLDIAFRIADIFCKSVLEIFENIYLFKDRKLFEKK